MSTPEDDYEAAVAACQHEVAAAQNRLALAQRRLADSRRDPNAETMRCPRRDESPRPDAYPGPDSYQPQHGLVSQTRGCSYCGSLPPGDFMAAVRDGAVVGPTDKSYKAYITLPTGEAKFYFQHLSEEQRHEFIALLNERPRRVQIGYPGHFYVLPFFIARGESRPVDGKPEGA